MRVDYSDDLDGNGKLQSGKGLQQLNVFVITMGTVITKSRSTKSVIFLIDTGYCLIEQKASIS